MPKKNDEDTFVGILFVVILALAFFWVYAVPPIEAWWTAYGVWVEVGLLVLVGIGLYYVYWRHKISVEVDREIREKLAREADERTRFENEQRTKGLVKFESQDGAVRWGTSAEIERWKRKELEESLPNRIAQAIRDFRPSRRYHQEFPYQTELQGWLKSKFPMSQIELQTGSSRPDIVIEDIAIEVKGPTDNRALETLAAKCLKYSGYYKKVILVLFEPRFSESNYREIVSGMKRSFPFAEVIRKD